MLLLLVIAIGFEVEFKKVFYLSRDIRTLGFGLDLKHDFGPARISIPVEKREKYRISGFLESDIVETRDLKKLLGKLSWCAQLIRHWRPKLGALYALTAAADRPKRGKPLRHVRLSASVRESLQSIWEALAEPCSVPLFGLKEEVWYLVSDACTYGFGGFFTDGTDYYWYNINSCDEPLLWEEILKAHLDAEAPAYAGLEEPEICYLELCAAVLGLIGIEKTLSVRLKDSHISVSIFCDNTAAVSALASWSPKSQALRTPLSWVPHWSSRVRSQHVPGRFNSPCRLH
ncbi:hypothetical protein Pmar_PMAR023423 [Perkinsus marinus ATCC 50983]|uniref:Uncharacterized protein n=1 Tax=Perkinsus marinus (strain ATCC 50983 / TXsc) TaxID=423536 RepID=C5KKI5_PERM5|nr:hypothetical protein Pmar_PMAR023423 [Perkinsus marinus ATCC 50983]EER15097.1 hypothetical protein Pmar_PMAR023423 [Perkinsus marinus ATCC 50983]|eukprot:XP_002783301.1 hypothetical protein Pmar_PMAR023423 [Perkinsus marinus ATCC 50983]